MKEYPYTQEDKTPEIDSAANDAGADLENEKIIDSKNKKISRIKRRLEAQGYRVHKLIGYGTSAFDHNAVKNECATLFFDDLCFWFVVGYDDASQETERLFFYSLKKAIEYSKENKGRHPA